MIVKYNIEQNNSHIIIIIIIKCQITYINIVGVKCVSRSEVKHWGRTRCDVSHGCPSSNDPIGCLSRSERRQTTTKSCPIARQKVTEEQVEDFKPLYSPLCRLVFLASIQLWIRCKYPSCPGPMNWFAFILLRFHYDGALIIKSTGQIPPYIPKQNS